MGEAIYSAGAFQAFLKSNLTALMLFGIGLAGLVGALIQRQQRRTARLIMGGAGLFLIAVGAVMGDPIGGLRPVGDAVRASDCGQGWSTKPAVTTDRHAVDTCSRP